MKKYFLPILVFAGLLSANAQSIRLKTNYTEPRLGQSITITLKLNFIEEHIKETLAPELELKGNSAFSNYAREIQVNDTGDFQVGPFLFEFNGKVYKTDSVILHVTEPLENVEGLWVRLIEYDSTQILIVEQHIENEWKKDKESKDPFSMSLSTTELEFAELIENPMEGLEFNFRQSNSYSVLIDEKDPFGASLAYSRKIYHVTNYSGEEIQLSEDFFENLPKKIELPEIIIKASN
ncbi:hypothetical protein [Croceimicrobium sp.]|uniref:hypothetical protein n=1 Tax=Croceimicrobium sp. TaxID=2828340 RepID=UPI003BAC1D05